MRSSREAPPASLYKDIAEVHACETPWLQYSSQIVYINAMHFSPLDVLSDRAVQSKYRLPRVEIQCLVTRLVSPLVSPSFTTHSEGNPQQFCPQPGGTAPGRAAFLRSGELPGGGGGRHRSQQGIGFTECGSRDTDSPAPCPDTHQNAHHMGRGPPDPLWISCHGWNPPGDWCRGWHTDPNPQSLPGGSVLDWEETLRCH